MATQTEEEQPKVTREKHNPFNVLYGKHELPMALDWALLGCLTVGAVGIFKAIGMESPSGVLLCLLGSVAAFGVVIYAFLRKH